jgi:hypothetical protein
MRRFLFWSKENVMRETKGEVLQMDAESDSETVLIVEDDPLVKGLTAKILRTCGYAIYGGDGRSRSDQCFVHQGLDRKGPQKTGSLTGGRL